MTKPEIVGFAVAAALLVPLVGLALVLVAAAIGGARVPGGPPTCWWRCSPSPWA